MLYIIGGVLGLLLLILILLQVPAVQTKLTQEVAGRFAKQWGTTVNIGKVNINFFETATLEDIYIEDQAGDTLLWAGYVKADIGAFALMGQRLELNEIALENAYINLYRPDGSAKFNYEFIVDSFLADSTATADTTASSFVFDLHQARLENVRLRYADDSTSMELKVVAPYLLAELETLGLQEQFIKIANVDIRQLQGSFEQIVANPVADTLATAPEVAQELDSAMLNPSGFRIAVEDFTVQNSHFHYKASKAAKEGTLNFQNLDLHNINIGITDFYLAGDTLRGSVEKLAAIDHNSGFELDNFAVDVALELPMFSATLHEVITPNTRIKDPIRLEQLSLKPGTDMLANLQLSTALKNAVLSMKDAAYFTPALDTLPKLRGLTLLLDLEAEVKDNKAQFSPLRLKTEDGGLFLFAVGEASGLNDLSTMRFDVQVQELSTTINYLEQFKFIPPLPPAAQQTGRLNLVAQAKGTPSNIDLAARLRSGVGVLETNMLYRAPTSSRFMLAGNVDATNFNLSPFVGDSLGLGEITLSSKVRVDGNGSQIDVPKFSVLVKEMEYNGYTYQGLAAEGYFVDSVMEVVAAYEDPYLNFDLMAHSDLKDSLPLVQAELNLDRLNMYRLNLSPDSIIISTKLVAEVRGQEPDNITGIVSARDTELIRGAESWTMDSLIVSSAKQANGTREISLTTDFMSAALKGKYLFKDLFKAAEQCVSYYCSAYKPTGDMVDYGQEITLDVKMWDEPIIAKAFLPQLELLHPLTLSAKLRDADRSFDMKLVAPGIEWDSIVVRNLTAEASTVERIMSFDVNASKIAVGEAIDIPQFRLDGQWAQDSVHFALGLAPPTDSTHLMVGGSLRFYSDTLALALDQTQLAIKGQDYQLSNDALIKYAPNYLLINNLALQQGNQLLRIDTEREKGPNPLLIAMIEQFQISDFMDIAGLSDFGLAATLNGRVQLTQPMNISAIEADLTVDQLMVDSLLVGDLKIEMDKVSDNGKVTANIALNGPGNEMLIDGYLNMEDSTNAMSLEVDIAALNLQPLEPFLEGFVTGIRGSLKGNIDIAGTLNQPRVDGRVNFSDNSAFRLALTGARYTLQNDYIAIDNEALRLDNFTLYDSLNQKMIVNGQVAHEFFTDYRFDLSVKAENFQVVNKERDMDALFYGDLTMSADARVTGPLEDVVVSGNLRVNDQTDFVLVIQTEEATATTASYIDFVEKNAFLEKDTLYVRTNGAPASQPDTLSEFASTNYFTLNTSIAIPEAATFTVVIDPNTGDYLEVQGTADLELYMAPSGDINLQGIYEVEEGVYRLSFMDVIKKNFYMEEGSTVAFNGDPLNAELNLTAIYNTEASRLPLMQSVEPGSQEYAAAKRKEPVSVLLNMDGTLESPMISFNITVPESGYGDFSSIVARRLDEIKQNESELFKQVFGLIVLNRFISENPLDANDGGGGGAGQAVNARINQSVGQFLTEQLNSVTQDYLGVELEIDLESNQGEQASLSGGRDVGFSLSRSLFNDKIEVQVGGVTSMGGAGGAGGAGGSGQGFAGNFAILYHVNDKGNLNLKIFQRNDRDLLTNEFLPKSGVAVSYFKNFNTIQGLFGDEPKRYEMLKSDGAVKTEM